MNYYPDQFEILKMLIWRMVRASLSAAIAQTLILQINWNQVVTELVTPSMPQPDLQLAILSLKVAFISGFLMGLFKYLRDTYGSKDGSGLINKIPL